MIYVIADDLTGATDTGVQFSKQGYNTVVSIADLAEEFRGQELRRSKPEVYVIDTETREGSGREARKRVGNLLKGLEVEREDITYKKVDSTLRGNIGIEIEAIMERLNKDICIFTPSFPSHHRIVSGGNLIVRDKPLGMSEYYQGQLDPGEASYIPSLLGEQTDLPVGRVDLKEVIKGRILDHINQQFAEGKKIIVIDAVNERNLKDILVSSCQFKGSILYAGSAGMAGFLSLIYGPTAGEEKFPEQGEGSFIIVGGSRNNILNSQIEFLKKKIEVTDIRINVKDILVDREKSLRKYAASSGDGIGNKYYLVIRPDPMFKKEKLINSLLEENNLSFRELEVKIRDFLGQLTSYIVEEYPVENIIITGGDTSIGVCRALGINNLNIAQEILPGIPLSRSKTNNHSLRLVTKAGGFGETDTLYKIIEKLNK